MSNVSSLDRKLALRLLIQKLVGCRDAQQAEHVSMQCNTSHIDRMHKPSAASSEARLQMLLGLAGTVDTKAEVTVKVDLWRRFAFA